MAGLMKLRRGIGVLDGRPLWTESRQKNIMPHPARSPNKATGRGIGWQSLFETLVNDVISKHFPIFVSTLKALCPRR